MYKEGQVSNEYERAREVSRKLFLDLLKHATGEDSASVVGLIIVVEHLSEIFPDKAERFYKALNKLGSQLGTTDTYDDFIDILADGNTWQEIEQKLRERPRNGYENIGRILTYQTKSKVIQLHIPRVFTENPAELRTMFVEALSELARRIENDPKFKDIQLIKGSSWIVLDNPKLAERFGFTVIGKNPKARVAQVQMTRDKFIELYGEKSKG